MFIVVGGDYIREYGVNMHFYVIYNNLCKTSRIFVDVFQLFPPQQVCFGEK